MVLSFRSIASDIGGSFYKSVKLENSISETAEGNSAVFCDFVEEVFQNHEAKLDIGRHPAVDSVTDMIYNELCAGSDVRLMTHSQDSTATNRALRDVKTRLMLEDRLTPREAEYLMSKIKIETFQHVSAG